MKVDEIRELNEDEIGVKLSEIKTELFDLRMKASTGTLDKPSRIKELRKTVARMKTVLNERKLELESGADDGK